ncbi:MAG: lipopolysaccharide kinase [Cycloclasticus sp.]|nr:MAG: lipopolysaccharide kinase [Cycloclasticus sp.]
MMHYISEKWRDILVFNDLDTYQKIWSLEAEWFEEPNQRRGGWSGVSRIELKLPLGGTVGMFLKRQEDHVTRSIAHPIKGFSTFLREYKVIGAFQKSGVPTLDLVLFDQWKEDGHQRACIMTEELVDYIPLSSDAYSTGGEFFSNVEQKEKVFVKLANLMRVMHRRNFQHNCFYPNHIFVRQLPGGDIDLRVIDLEKVKKVVHRKRAVLRDFNTLMRHSFGWVDDDKLGFFKIYQGENELSYRSKRLWKQINNKKS